MAYINIKTKQIVNPSQIMNENSNISFPNGAWSDELLLPLGYAELNRPVTHPFPSIDEKLVDGEPYQENGKWYLPWVTQKLTAEEIESNLLNKRSDMVVSSFQAKAALLQAGLLDNIVSYINNPDTDPMVKLAWDNATEFRRLSPMIIDLGKHFDLTDNQLDNLFVTAASITA